LLKAGKEPVTQPNKATSADHQYQNNVARDSTIQGR
jgi:hypothetical protein